VASNGWLYLAAMIAAYGVANLLQSMAAARTRLHQKFDPSLLISLASHRPYLYGLAFQLLGFILAFLARGELPLFLVQASVAAGLGVTAILGVGFLKWQLPRLEVAMLGGLVAGISALVLSAQPAPPRQLSMTGEMALAATLGVVALLGIASARLRGAPGSVVLGALAGLAFSAAAIASRPLTAVDSARAFVTDPLFFLMVAHGIAGQVLLGLAMQRGSTTASVASMDAANALPAAVVGLLVLGDEIKPGREWLAGIGFLVTLASVLGLTRYASPQYHCPAPAPEARHRRRGRVPVIARNPMPATGPAANAPIPVMAMPPRTNCYSRPVPPSPYVILPHTAPGGAYAYGHHTNGAPVNGYHVDGSGFANGNPCADAAHPADAAAPSNGHAEGIAPGSRWMTEPAAVVPRPRRDATARPSNR